jgi:hypothetical protein
MKRFLNWLLILIGVTFFLVGVINLKNTGGTFKSANFYTAFLASGIILILSSLRIFLSSTLRKGSHKKVLVTIIVFISILMLVAIITGIRFILLPTSTFGLKLFITVFYVLLPAFNIIDFIRLVKPKRT